LFDLDNNYITDPSGGYVKAKASFVEEIKKVIASEEEYDKELFTDTVNEFYARLKIDLNTCYTVTWASSSERVLATNSAGQPLNSAGSPYVAGTTTLIPKEDYTYTTVHLPSNGTNEFSFSEVYRTALRD